LTSCNLRIENIEVDLYVQLYKDLKS